MKEEILKGDVPTPMPDEETLFELSELFKLFGDSTRIEILCALMQEESCVGDLSERLGVSQSAISHQLRVLRGSRLVKARRSGQLMFYSLDDDHVHSIIRIGLEHVAHTKGGAYDA